MPPSLSRYRCSLARTKCDCFGTTPSVSWRRAAQSQYREECIRVTPTNEVGNRKLLVLMLVVVSVSLRPDMPSARGLQPSKTLTDKALVAREQLTASGIPYTGDAFVSSAASGDVRTVELFLAAGLNLNTRNRDGFTALMWSAGQGHLQVV